MAMQPVAKPSGLWLLRRGFDRGGHAQIAGGEGGAACVERDDGCRRSADGKRKRGERLVEGGEVELALRAVPPGTWRDLAQAVASRLIGHAQPTVILVDELPILMLKLLEAPDGKRRAADLLDWHRELRLASNAAHLRWVLGGSIGIETVASKHNLTSRFNDLAPLDLGPFTDDEAHGFLVHLAFRLGQGASFPPDVREYLIERVGQEQREEVGAFLLDVLVSDGYLVQQGRRFRFRSPLLRQYWLRRFGVEE